MKNNIKKIISTGTIGLAFAGASILLVSFTPVQQVEKWVAPATADKQTNPTTVNAQNIAAAKIVFTKNCEQCHGKKGKGDGPKSAELERQVGDMTTADFSKQSDGALFWKITQGRKPMPSFKKELSDDQRWLVILYVRELGKPKAKK